MSFDLFNPIWPREGGGGLTSIIENFLDIHRKATKSGDFSPNLLENKVVETFYVNGIIVFNTSFGEILLFFQILMKYFKQLVILGLEVNLGIFFGT